jgi:poly-gamma-glutamate capsule biosynthesis protein CapA/YwtB (metallophosphatase superfamily)
MGDAGHHPSQDSRDRSILLLGMLSGSLVALLLWPQSRASSSTPVDPPLGVATSVAPVITFAPNPPASLQLSSGVVEPAEPTVRLLFTGDINPGRCIAQVALRYDDFTIPYQLVVNELSSADITIGSLDGSISDMAPPEACPQDYPYSSNLIGPARTVEGLAYAGFDVMTVATNHALDCGSLGWGCNGQILADTRRNLLGQNIQPVGIGDSLSQARAPVIVERQGVRFAFLAMNAVSGDATWVSDSRPGTAPLSADTIMDVTADITAARSVADVVIVLPHWGVEDGAVQVDERAWAAQMIAAGADLVIGNHPHVIQAVETYPRGGVVAYALGNFVFDQGPMQTRRGVVFEAVFQGSRLTSWKILPLVINGTFQPGWANSFESAVILNQVEVANQELIGK